MWLIIIPLFIIAAFIGFQYIKVCCKLAYNSELITQAILLAFLLTGVILLIICLIPRSATSSSTPTTYEKYEEPFLLVDPLDDQRNL